MLFLHKLIEQRAAGIDDPVERLRYLRQSMQTASSAESALAWVRSQDVWTRDFWKTTDFWKRTDFWRTRGSWMMLSLVAFSVSMVVWRPAHTTVTPKPAVLRPSLAHMAAPAATLPAPPSVWLVEARDGFENYSNGLRIDNKYAVANEARQRYAMYGYPQKGGGIAAWKDTPSGIVFHTTESLQAPFEARENRKLIGIGSAVLEFVKSNRSYHFVIDRFGRVFRIVKETDIANHAGKSIWGDDKGIFVNLNASFIGISFESATDPAAPNATPAQIHSGRILTEMLRSKYGIRAADCVTHAQVSVNPGNMLIGYHTDWAGVFPFSEMGLPDNYATPPASLFAFGFGYDDTYVKITGNIVWRGLLMAEDQMQRQAAASGMPLSKYKAVLQRRYREITAALKPKSPGKENDDES